MLAKKAEERGRKHSRDDDDMIAHPRKRSRSVSSYSSSSVSTISTNRSPTRSPSPHRHEASKRTRRPAHSPAGDDRKRRRRSVSSSAASYSDRNDKPPAKERNTRRRRSSFSPGERGRPRSRSFVSNHNGPSRSRSRGFERSVSPFSKRAHAVPRLSPVRRPRSRSPRRRAVPPSREPVGAPDRPHRPPPDAAGPPPPSFRQRSLSPYSKRLALTQSMNMGGR